MNKEQKAAAVEQVAAQIEGAEAVLAVDYRGISVPQAAALREKLNDAGARFRVVKNTLTLRAAERAADGGDVALAAKALAQFRREHALLDFKGGRMNGEPLTVEQIQEIAALPARDVLDGQLVGVLASPVTGLVRGLNQLIAGLAMQLGQIADEGLVGGDAPAAGSERPDPNEDDLADQAEAAEPAGTDAESGTEEPETEPPSEGDDQKES